MELKDASAEDRERKLDNLVISADTGTGGDMITTPQVEAQLGSSPHLHILDKHIQTGHPEDALDYESDTDLDLSPFFSVDETGKIDSFGPSSALQASIHRPFTNESVTPEQIRNNLFANAAMQRQREYELSRLPDIDGVPTSLAIHLLDLHWSRQHHTFLLTYRPAITRDILDSGPYCSPFLLQAIFACSSKFSQRPEVRDDPADPTTAGRRFFRRCDQLLGEEMLLATPSVNTTVGLLLLGSTFNALGMISKGWLYTGYALRMIYDLGYHLDCKVTVENAMRVEIRRRLFWGAFICDKLQSLYLGRPVAMQLRDSHVSRYLMDVYEEREISMPYIDPTLPSSGQAHINYAATPQYSISTFQHFCLLSKIMTMIINKFYVVGATAATATAALQAVENALESWKTNLPKELQYDANADNLHKTTTPAVMNLHCIFQSLVILLHRPLISDGHLRLVAPPQSSWKRCSDAAREITSLLMKYQSLYTLRSAPYLLGYGLYVACTIHVRNAAASEIPIAGEHASLLVSSLNCLEELSLPNPGVLKPLSIIRNLMRSNKLDQIIDIDGNVLLHDRDLHEVARIEDFNLDVVLRMFPGGDDDMLSNASADTSRNFQYDDILYGFMDV